MYPGSNRDFFTVLILQVMRLSIQQSHFAIFLHWLKIQGLHLTIHAGEACGPENVREAVIDFKADRIGHGVRSVEDSSIMALLRERRILLELCLTSNVHTGVVTSVEAHPIRRLMEAGVPVSINTDDPAISDITLSGEYVEAVTKLGFTESELKALNLQALDHAFHPDKDI